MYSLTAGPLDSVWFVNFDSNSIGRVTMQGAVSNYTSPDVIFPTAITRGSGSDLWFTNQNDNSIGRFDGRSQFLLAG